MTNHKTKKLTVLAIMIALDVFLTPIFRIEGMAFMSSVVNIIAGVIMGPIYALVMALVTAFIRILTQAGVASVCCTFSYSRSWSRSFLSGLVLSVLCERLDVLGG